MKVCYNFSDSGGAFLSGFLRFLNMNSLRNDG